jgi:acetolactate synthase-1/2/3 large subunit
VIICANRSYNILNIELARVGALNPGPTTLAMLDLTNPEIDFAKLAQAQGVPATTATNTKDFAAQFAEAMNTKGPRLIEAVIADV